MILVDALAFSGEMWRFKQAAMGMPVYRGQMMNLTGIRAKVEVLKRGSTDVECGVINRDSTLNFRSRSAR